MSQQLSLDETRQTLAKAYAGDRLRVGAASHGLSALGLLVLGPAGLAVALRNWVESVTGTWVLEILLFFAVAGLAGSLLNLPMTYYRGFILPHRYKQSNQSLAEWSLDLFKGIVLGSVLGAATVEMLYVLLRADATWWWLWVWIGFTLLSVALTALAPSLLIPLFFKLRPVTDQDLNGEILDLARKAGTRVQDVREINLSSKTPAANAAVVGMGMTRKIVLGDTLLEQFPAEEVQVVVAHELGHHVHRDLGKGLAVETTLGFVGFALAGTILNHAVDYWHFKAVWDLGAFPVLAVILGAWTALSRLLTRAFSRRREEAADAYSLWLTGLGEAFRNSEIRLTNQNLGWFHPPIWMELLFYTHPAPWRRVAMGDRYLNDQSTRS